METPRYTWPVDLVRDSGNENLDLFVLLGVEEIIFVLLSVSTKEEVNARNNKNKTPIFYARTPKMVQLLLLHEDTDLRVKDRDQHTLLEGLLRTNGECAKALLSSGVTTNGKEHTDKDLLLIYDLEIFTKSVKVSKILINLILSVVREQNPWHHPLTSSCPWYLEIRVTVSRLLNKLIFQ